MSLDYGGLFSDVKSLIAGLLNVYMYVVIIRVVISWINPDPYNPIVQFLRNLTDPPLDWLRHKLPKFMWSSGLDFTPLVLILGIQVLISLLHRIHF